MTGSKLVTATKIQRMLIIVERGTMKKDRGIDQEIIVIVMIEKETHAMVMIDKDMLVIVIGILAKFIENVRETLEKGPRTHCTWIGPAITVGIRVKPTFHGKVPKTERDIREIQILLIAMPQTRPIPPYLGGKTNRCFSHDGNQIEQGRTRYIMY